MKIYTRANMRGKPLDIYCRVARISKHEYGPNDNRIFCYGLYADGSNYEIDEKCLACGAFVDNAKPLKEF